MLHLFAHLVACCCAKFATGPTFQPTTPNISFVPWSPKRSATMLDPFPQLFQHCWGHARSLRMATETYGLYSFHNAPQVPNFLGVVASVCTPLPTCTQQLPTLLDQQCWELLCPFVRSHRNCSEVWQRRWPWGNQTQLLNVCYLVPFLFPTSLWIQSSLLVPHGEGQLCSSIFHLIVLTVACELLICISFVGFQMPCPTWCLVKWKTDQALGIITPFIAQQMDKN